MRTSLIQKHGCQAILKTKKRVKPFNVGDVGDSTLQLISDVKNICFVFCLTVLSVLVVFVGCAQFMLHWVTENLFVYYCEINFLAVLKNLYKEKSFAL